MKFVIFLIALGVHFADIHSAPFLRDSETGAPINLRDPDTIQKLNAQFSETHPYESSETTSSELADASQKAGYTNEEIQAVRRLNRKVVEAKAMKIEFMVRNFQSLCWEFRSDFDFCVFQDEFCSVLGKDGRIIPVPTSETEANDIQNNWERVKMESWKNKLRFWTNILKDSQKTETLQAVALVSLIYILLNTNKTSINWVLVKFNHL